VECYGFHGSIEHKHCLMIILYREMPRALHTKDFINAGGSCIHWSL
jgi:hypothetical protein